MCLWSLGEKAPGLTMLAMYSPLPKISSHDKKVSAHCAIWHAYASCKQEFAFDFRWRFRWQSLSHFILACLQPLVTIVLLACRFESLPWMWIQWDHCSLETVESIVEFCVSLGSVIIHGAARSFPKRPNACLCQHMNPNTPMSFFMDNLGTYLRSLAVKLSKQSFSPVLVSEPQNLPALSDASSE